MAAKIGILGESTVTATGTTTVYTVPSDKSARVRVLFEVEGGAGGWQYSVFMGTPGSEITFHVNQSSGDDAWSGTYNEATPDPAGSFVAAVQGIQTVVGGIQLTEVNPGDSWQASPYSFDYYLSDGDTVRFNINGTAATDSIFQVLGVEDDA